MLLETQLRVSLAYYYSFEFKRDISILVQPLLVCFSRWMGVQPSMTRPDVRMVEGEAGLYDGVKIQRVLQNLGAVGVLDLDGMGCEGTLPEDIGVFNKLKQLRMSVNTITGTIPSNANKMQRIEIFDLSGNQLSGEYDDECFSGMGPTCTNFDISFNEISGVIPECWETFTMLETLNLSGNQFVGRLPASFSNLVKLKHLKLYDNQLEGTLPDVFQNCLNLEEINVSENKLGGSHPLSLFSKCLKLKRIHLGYNQFDGDLNISCLADLKDLEFLYVNHNHFTGTIESELCQLKKLKFINFSNNRLTGVLPEDFGNLQRLEICIFSENQIQGPVPRSMSLLTNLRDFHIFNQWRSEHMELPREFKSYTYQRLYHDAIKLHIDSLCWLDRFAQEEEIEKRNATRENSSPKSDKRKKKRKKKKSHGDDLVIGGKMDEMSLEEGSSIGLASPGNSVLHQTIETASSHTITTEKLNEIKDQFKEKDTSHRINVNR